MKKLENKQLEFDFEDHKEEIKVLKLNSCNFTYTNSDASNIYYQNFTYSTTNYIYGTYTFNFR